MRKIAALLTVCLGLLVLFSIDAKASSSNFDVISNTIPVEYYTRIKNSSHNYGVYATGGYNSSLSNHKPISYSAKFKNRIVHITKEQIVNDQKWVKFTYNHKFSGWIHINGTDKQFRRLNVPLIAQRPELPTGCEVTATTMMLNYAGDKSSKMKLAREMPRSSNPNRGFVGNPYSPSGWWIYPKGLMGLVKRHLGSSIDMTNASFDSIKKQIDKGHPVVVWVAKVDGFPNHAITISGYSDKLAYYNDPWTNKKTAMKISTLQYHRKLDKYMALSY